MKLVTLSALAVVSLGPVTGSGLGEVARTVRFDRDTPGEPPPGFTCARTGQGRAGVWRILHEGTAGPSRVLAQTDEDATSFRFPLCVLDDVTGTDVDVSVRFKPVRGAKDQAAGLVWRYRDPNNYYVVRANALEDNVVLYKVEQGKRSDLDPKGSGLFTYGRKAAVPSGTWSTLRVVVQGSLFRVFLNGRELFEVEDSTFGGAGKVGVWTKADSVTYFDDLEVKVSQ